VRGGAASARLGARTALLTLNLEMVAQMSCNPSVGGIAKGHLVREIDALGGIMAEIADASGIQFRLLNRSRGPAVRAPRSQNDKALYRRRMSEGLRAVPGLVLVEGEAAAIREEAGRVSGVSLADGRELSLPVAGVDDRHLPERALPRRGTQVSRRPFRGARLPAAGRADPRPWFEGGADENRHTGAARSHDHRLRGLCHAGRGSGAGFLFLPDPGPGAAAAALLGGCHQ
jgi:hypothetical protein